MLVPAAAFTQWLLCNWNLGICIQRSYVHGAYTNQQVQPLRVEGFMCCVAFKKPSDSVLTDPAHLGAKDFRAGLEVGSICVTVTPLKINLNKKTTFPTNNVIYNLPKVKRLFELNLGTVL